MKENRRKTWTMILLIAIISIVMASTVFAAEISTGWKQKGKKILYYVTSEKNAAKVVKAKGLQKIGKKYFYFNKSGVLQTGWVETEDGFRYFKPNGTMGKKGAMYTGLKTIGKDKFYFGDNGVVKTGKKTLDGKTYYFGISKKMGSRGKALKNIWKTLKGKRYYFGTDGVMVTSAWVNKTYYVDANGEAVTNTVTPDGYLVDAEGKKVGNKKIKGWVKIGDNWKYYYAAKKKFLVSRWKTSNGSEYYLDGNGNRVTGWQTIKNDKYYFNSNGVMQTGWQTIGKKKYYFGSDGKMQKNTTIDGYILGEDGIATRDPDAKAKILIIAGHGQGDPGATSSWGYESTYTRELSKLIYNQLKSSGDVDVTYYKNGSTNYDCYRQNVTTLGSAGLNIASKITGKGTIKNKVLAGIKKNKNLPVFSDYDYVLEVHFNATASNKNPNGDGSYTGVGFYINSYRKNYKLEKNIISSIVKLGFKQWGAGVFASSTLFNARVCQELGVEYGLLETAFIDDGDDMKFYKNNKKRIAKTIAEQIVKNFS